MASDKEYLQFVLECLRDVPYIGYRAMMGEFVIYLKDKVAGGIFDNRFLIKTTRSALQIIEDPIYELPYEKGSPMLLIEDIENSEFMKELLSETYYEELPEIKKKKKKTPS